MTTRRSSVASFRGFIVGVIAVLMSPSAAVLATTQDAASSSPSQEDEAAVMAVVEASLERISDEDLIGFTDLMLEGAVIASAGVRARSGESFAALRTRAGEREGILEGDMLERGFDATVMVSGPVAMVWLPYDFYRNGDWSHCGIDVFTLLKTESEWRIATLTYSVEQPPDCRPHPDGAPRNQR